jgi:hypothetical protein
LFENICIKLTLVDKKINKIKTTPIIGTHLKESQLFTGHPGNSISVANCSKGSNILSKEIFDKVNIS